MIGGFIAATLGIPALLVGVSITSEQGGCGSTEQILATIRTVESGERYDARNVAASASGAYQMVDMTWRYWAQRVDVDVSLYPSAWMAPPAMQDAAARAHVEDILSDEPVEAVPVVWYWPKALGDPELMAQVPPWPGNKLTVAQYQEKWLGELAGPGCAVAPGPETELVEIGQGGHKLRGDAAAGFAAWQAAYGAMIPITDSYRSWDLQARRHAEEPGRFVAPEHSAHVAGNAVDVNMGLIDEARLLEAARATGWCQSAVKKREPWHFSFSECR